MKKSFLLALCLLGFAGPSLAGPLSTTQRIDVRDFGAKCDGVANDATAINNAIAAAGSDGAIIQLPAGTCATTAEILINRNGITIEGAGQGTTFLKPSSSINGIHITGSSTAGVFHNTVRNLGVQGGLSGIWIDKGSNDTRIEDVTLSSGVNGISIIGDFHSKKAQLEIHTVHINRVEVSAFTGDGIYVQEAGELFLSAIRTYSTSIGAGIRLETGANAVYADRLNLLATGYGLLIQNTVPVADLSPQRARPSQMFFTSVLGDTTKYAGIQSNDGYQISFQKPWGSGSGGYGVYIAPAADEIELAEGYYIFNVKHGVFVKGPRTTRVRIIGGKAISNGRDNTAPPLYDGIAIDDNCENVQVIGVAAYNSDNSPQGQGYGNTQRYGISIGNSSKNYIVSQNHTIGNLTGGVNDLGSTPKVVTDNLP